MIDLGKGVFAYPRGNGNYKLGNEKEIFADLPEYKNVFGLTQDIETYWFALDIKGYSYTYFFICQSETGFDLLEIEKHKTTVTGQQLCRNMWNVQSAKAIEKYLSLGMRRFRQDKSGGFNGYVVVETLGYNRSGGYGLVDFSGKVVEMADNVSVEYLGADYYLVKKSNGEYVVNNFNPKESYKIDFNFVKKLEGTVCLCRMASKGVSACKYLYDFSKCKGTAEQFTGAKLVAPNIIEAEYVHRIGSGSDKFIVLADTLEILEDAVYNNGTIWYKDIFDTVQRYNMSKRVMENVPLAVAKSLGCPFIQ